MDDDEFALLLNIEAGIDEAKAICDPAEFAVRQKRLLWAIGEFFKMMALREKERRKKADKKRLSKTRKTLAIPRNEA